MTALAPRAGQASPGVEPALRALQVVAGLHPDQGGTSYSVPSLSAALAAKGADVALYHLADPGGADRPSTPPPYRQLGYPQTWTHVPGLSALRLSRGLAQGLARAARQADVVHNHGLWLAPSLAAQHSAWRAGKPYVCSPRGMLSPEALAFSPLRKRAVWALWQRSGLAGAACLHATSEAELGEIRALGLAAPVAVIANGIDLPLPVVREPRPAQLRTLLSLGRVHPKKDLPELLRAWARIEPAHPGWRLRIVGPAERGHDGELRALAAELRLARVSIEGPIHGEAKRAAYREADLFVVPTRNENFGLTVAEALAAGVPVVCTRGAPWAGLESHRCGWWVDRGAESLAAALDQALAATPAALSEMGARGRRWMAEDFSWERVAADMLALYAWLAGRGDRPACVHLD